MSSNPKPSFAAYKEALKAVSLRTGAPLAPLIASFGILHEITAVAPLVAIFYGARALGVGERLVTSIRANVEDDSLYSDRPISQWTKDKVKTWIQEGDIWAIRVGRRYGLFGYEKRAPGEKDDMEQMLKVSGHLAGDVANAVFAYGLTKALIPVRLGVSLYFAPAFARGAILPLQKSFVSLYQRVRRRP